MAVQGHEVLASGMPHDEDGDAEDRLADLGTGDDELLANGDGNEDDGNADDGNEDDGNEDDDDEEGGAALG